MTKRVKRILLTVLSCLLFVCVTIAAACKTGGGDTVTLQLKDNQAVYRVGEKLDAFDFFVKESGVTYAFEMEKKSDGSKEAMTTNVYHLTEIGDYALTCSASKGGSKDKKKVEFSVAEVPPFVVVSAESRTVNLDEECDISNIVRWARANTFQYGNDCEFFTDYVDYYEDEYDTTAEREEFTAAQETYKFTKEGMYLFHFVLKNDGGESYGQFRIFCVEDLSEVTELPNAINFDKSSNTVTWQAVEGAAKYKVKVGMKFMETTATTLDVTSIVPATEFKYFDVIVLPLNAAGEKMGKMTVPEIVINPEGFGDQVVLSRNTTIDVQNKKVSVPSSHSEATIQKLQLVNADYVAFHGDFGAGYYMDFTFKGNNLPVVTLFADEINGSLTGQMDGEGNKGVLLINGTTDTGGTFMADHLRVYGPNRIPDTYWNNTGVLFTTAAAVEQDKRPAFGLDYLMDTPNDEYKYTVGSFADSEGNVYLDISLYKKSLQGEYEIMRTEKGVSYRIVRSLGLKESELTGRNIVVYSSMQGVGQSSDFTFTLPEYKGDSLKPQALATGAVSSKAVFYEDGTLALREDNAWKALTGTKEPVEGNKYMPDAYETLQNGYIGFENGYELGDYLKITFGTTNYQGTMRADNMPNVILFSNSFDPGFTATSGTGILVTSGIDVCDRVYKCANNDRMLIYGPNRMPDKTAFGSASNLTGGNFLYEAHPLFTQYGLYEQTEGTFTYVLGSYASATNTVVLDISVYHQDDKGNIIGANSRCYDTGIKVTDLSGNKLLLTAANRQGTWDAYTEFKLDFCESRAKALEGFEVEANAKINGSMTKTSGSVSLAQDNYYANGRATALETMQNGYVGLKDSYEVGKYLRISFTTSEYYYPTQAKKFDTEADGEEPKERILAVAAANNPVNEDVYAYPQKDASGNWVKAWHAAWENEDGTKGANRFVYYYTDYHDRYDGAFADWENHQYGEKDYADNMPNVILFTDEMNGGYTAASGKGLLISGGLGACNETKRNDYNGSLVIHGPNRVANKDSFLNGLYKDSTKTLLTEWGLLNLHEGNFTYIVGTYLGANGTVLVDLAMYQEVNGAVVAYSTLVYDTGLAPEAFTGKGLVMAATNKTLVYGYDTTFSYALFNDKASAMPADLTLTKDSLQDVTLNNTAHVNSLTHLKTQENAYHAFTGEYGIGTYVDTYFTSSTEPNGGNPTDYGNDNIPNILFFVDDEDINGYKTSNGGSGVLVTNGIGYYGYTDKTDAKISKVRVFGPNRIAEDSYDANIGELDYSQYPLLTQRGLIEDTTESVYKYTVGTEEKSGKLVVVFSLYRQNGSSWTPVYENVEMVTTLDASAVKAGNILLMAENKQQVWEATTQFKVSMPYTK